MASIVRFALCLCALLVFSSPLHAASLLTASGYPSTVFNPQGGWQGLDRVVGYSFTVGQAPLQVTALGMWDHEQNGLPAQLYVALWDDDTNAMLASVLVPSGTTARLEGEFRYVDLLDPVQLDPGKTYTLGYRKTIASSAGLVQTMRTGPTFSPDVTLALASLRTVTQYFLPGTPSGARNQYPDIPVAPLADQRPTQFLGGGADDVTVGPNLLYNILAVPAPTGLAVAAAGLTLLLQRRPRGAV